MVDCSPNETLAHVVVFAARHIPDGVKILLDVNFFKITLKPLQNPQRDINDQKTLLMVVAEVLSYDSSAEANKKFFTTELPQTCLEILQRCNYF